jgi:hypothetical protein
MTGQVTPAGAVRLTFSYDQDDVQLTDSSPVDMVVPPSDPLSGYEGQTGFWVELRDSDDRTVYRRILHDPMPSYVEVHSPSGRPLRAAVAERRGIFDTVIPALSAGGTAVLFGAPQPDPVPIGDFRQEQARAATPRVPTQPATEIARFRLDGTAS